MALKKSMINTPYSRAYMAWFSEYERERRRQKKRPGAKLAGFPEAPPDPENIAYHVDKIGARRTLEALGVHRATLARWLAGTSVMPLAAWRLLVVVSDGLLPGMSEDWRQWRFEGDRLCLVGTRYSFSARELAGLPFQAAHAQALAAQVEALQKENAYLMRVGDFEAANDPLICVS